MEDLTITIGGSSASIGEPGKVISDDIVFESVVQEESINGDGGITVGWNSRSGNGLPAGTMCNGYVLMQPYLPSRNSDGSYRYDVKFSDPIALLGKALFYKNVDTIDEKGNEDTMPLYTFNYVGIASTIINALGAAIEAAGLDAEVQVHIGSPDWSGSLISVSFDGDTIKSAASKIATACDVPLWFTDGTMHFGAPTGSEYLSGDYYNHFVVLGGTKNMTKKIVNVNGEEEYAAVTKRLALDPDDYPGSIIGSGSPSMTKLLVFDDIFPKPQMRIVSTYERKCYLLDENGEKINIGTEQAPVYATYSKWYIKLANLTGTDNNNIDQTALDSLIIDGTTLKIQFLPFSEGGNYPLSGRDFELVHFYGANSDDVTECEEDDIEIDGHKGHTITAAQMAAGDWYRIVIAADGSTLLPSTLANGLVPAVGQIVSFINIAVPDGCVTAARAKLLAAGQEAARTYTAQTPSTASVDEHIGEHSQAALGDVASGGMIVTSIRTNLITQERTVTYGTLKQKGLISSLIDKVDGAQTTGGGGTTTEKSSQVNATSQEQWDALAKAGGHRGVVALNKRIKDSEDSVAGLAVDVRNIEQQTDQSILIWYGIVDPTTSNYPASEWQTEGDKELHLGDFYYNENREPASTGGRAWKWSKETVEGVTVYGWESVTDLDTLASLEKIADVASDGIITGGEEKQRLYFEWKQATVDYTAMTALATTYGLLGSRDYDEYVHEFGTWLGYINGNAEVTSGMYDGSERPAWITSSALTTSTKLSDYNLTPSTYRLAKDNFDSSAALLRSAIESMAKEALDSIADMGSDSKLTPDEKVVLVRDFRGLDSDARKISAQCTTSNLQQYGRALTAAFTAIGTYLNGGVSWSRVYQDGVLLLPSWLKDYPTRTENINAETWNSLWTKFYEERAAANMALNNKAQQDAAAAIAQAAGGKAVTVSSTRPVPPYNAGDMWLDVGSNELWVCQTTRAAGDTPSEDDWLSVESGGSYLSNVTDHYADFATLFCSLVESYYGTREGNTAPSLFKVYISATQPTGYNSQDVWYEGTNDGVFGTIHWNGHTSYYADDNTSLQDLRPSLTEIQSYGFTSFTVYNGTPSGDANPRSYDVLYRRLSFQDSFTKELVFGGVDVFVFNAKRSLWEKVQDGVSGLMENYGDHLIMSCFGTNDDGTTNYASRLLTAKNFTEMVSEATPQDDDKDKVLAAIRTIIEEENGQLTSKVKIHANQLDLDNGDENTGLLSMSTGKRTSSPSSGAPSELLESGFQLSEGANEIARLKLATLLLNASQETTLYDFTDPFNCGNEQSIASSGYRIKSAVLQLIGELFSQSNPNKDSSNRAYISATTLSPFGIASRRFAIRRYNLSGGSWSKEVSIGVDGTFTSADGKTITVEGGIITGIS